MGEQVIDNNGRCMLSVVMISIPERAIEFYRLKGEILKQIEECQRVHPSLGRVEIVTIVTESFTNGGESIGSKRQKGLDMSKGHYVCWTDDDDLVSPDYIETILRLSLKDADILTFNNISKLEGYWMAVRMSLEIEEDEQPRPGIINRRPYHVCAFKRSLLKGISFPDLNWDEDTEFIKLALERCKTESHSEAILHQYNRGVRQTENWRKS